MDSITVVPDALFGIERRRGDRKLYRFFALEADRGTMPIARTANAGTSILAKLEVYRSILAHEIYRNRFGIPNLLILTVTTSEARCSEMVKQCAGFSLDGRPFLFRAFAGETAPNSRLLSEPWQRPSALPLHICE